MNRIKVKEVRTMEQNVWKEELLKAFDEGRKMADSVTVNEEIELIKADTLARLLEEEQIFIVEGKIDGEIKKIPCYEKDGRYSVIGNLSVAFSEIVNKDKPKDVKFTITDDIFSTDSAQIIDSNIGIVVTDLDGNKKLIKI